MAKYIEPDMMLSRRGKGRFAGSICYGRKCLCPGTFGAIWPVRRCWAEKINHSYALGDGGISRFAFDDKNIGLPGVFELVGLDRREIC
jgi:hypothetical protein